MKMMAVDNIYRDTYNNLPGEYKTRTCPTRLTRDFWIGDIMNTDESWDGLPSGETFTDPYGETPIKYWNDYDFALYRKDRSKYKRLRNKYDHDMRTKGYSDIDRRLVYPPENKYSVKVVFASGKVKIFENAHQASKYIGVSYSAIGKWIHGVAKCSYGHKVSYVENKGDET